MNSKHYNILNRHTYYLIVIFTFGVILLTCSGAKSKLDTNPGKYPMKEQWQALYSYDNNE